jgi:hypothetical protein
MIDPLTEPLIRPSEATRLYPAGANGKPIDVTRVYRDMRHGRDGIRLESIRTPRLATSREAVARFFLELTAARATSPEVRGHRRPTAPPRANQQVERELDRLRI